MRLSPLPLITSLSTWMVFATSTDLNETHLDCEMRVLSLRYAYGIQSSWRSDHDPLWKEIYEALQLSSICGVPFEQSLFTMTDKSVVSPETKAIQKTVISTPPRSSCATKFCLYVDPQGRVDADGSISQPFPRIINAIHLSRRLQQPYNTTIVLLGGIHVLNETMVLDRSDSGLSIFGAPGEQVWISGGVEIPKDTKWDWDCRINMNIRVANLTELLHGYNHIPRIPSLFTSSRRLIRARYPNGDPETSQWGYNSPRKDEYSIPPDQVMEWHRPPPGVIPKFTYFDLRKPPQGVPMKNDSAQNAYNIFATGEGGVCADVWGPYPSYWCSNASSGGWAEVDRECAMSGQLQIPIGLTYNRTSELGQRIEQRWGPQAVGGIVHAWHSQTWAMHMFEIQSQNPGELHFAPGGGRQGGRNWCRCDQCNYIAPWCGQRQQPPVNDNRLISGNWMVENILTELDQPGEFFFDAHSKHLYLFPNKTLEDETGLRDLRFALLETLIKIHDGATDIFFWNIGFRDNTLSYIGGDWAPPSGGDWSLHRGGAIVIEDANMIYITNCTFRRLDGNGILIANKTRGVQIKQNTFEWLGESAVVLWGRSSNYDATDRTYPLDTVIHGNAMKELGIFQKQSSAISNNKAAKTIMMNNIMFNMPRAAINFNDMMGGGDVVYRNLIFNTCRESGDHGPINTWDRQPFMTDLPYDKKTFVPLRRRICYNLIFANYGAAEGIDNDDGSSWYHIFNNVLYNSEGFKMDYGGHDSIFEENLVVSYPRRRRRFSGSRCISFDSFLPGHGHIVRRNTCIVPNLDGEPIIQLEVCNNSHALLFNNTYYLPNGGQASVLCGYDPSNRPISFSDAQKLYGLELGSRTHSSNPGIDFILMHALLTLFPGKSGGLNSHLNRTKASFYVDATNSGSDAGLELPHDRGSASSSQRN